MVNQVFGDAAAPGGIVPPGAAAACARGRRQHASARPEPGEWAELRHADDLTGRFAAPPAILRETDVHAVWTSPRRCATSARRRRRISAGARVRWRRRRKALCTWRRTISRPVAWLALVRAAATFDKRGRGAGEDHPQGQGAGFRSGDFAGPGRKDPGGAPRRARGAAGARPCSGVGARVPGETSGGARPVPAAKRASAEADAAPERRCLRDGAMTRAKRALEMITEPIGAQATSPNFPRWLRDAPSAPGRSRGGGRRVSGRAGIGERVGETGATARRGLARTRVRNRVGQRGEDGRV